MIRLLPLPLISLLWLHSPGFAQLGDRYVHRSAEPIGYIHRSTGPTGYVASSSSTVIDEASFRLILSPAGPTSVDISIEKLPDTPIELRLRDEDRYTLFAHHSRTDAPLFVRRIDLRELDNGTYWLAIRVGKTHLTRKVRLASLSATEQLVILEE